MNRLGICCLVLALLLGGSGCRRRRAGKPCTLADCLPNQGLPVLDLAQGAWNPGPNLPGAYRDAQATLLEDGRVLLTGGMDPAGEGQATLWHPDSGLLKTLPAVGRAGCPHLAVRLGNGRVFVAFGQANRTVEIFDPSTDTFQPVPWPNHLLLREDLGHRLQAVRLPDGRLFILTSALAMDGEEPRAILFDPREAAFTLSCPLPLDFARGAAVLVPGGKVLLFGGRKRSPGGAPPPDDVWTYDPAQDVCARAGQMGALLYDPWAALLPDGTVLVAGRRGPNDDQLGVEAFEPRTGHSRPLQAPAPRHATSRIEHLIAGPGGQVLLFAGGSGEIFRPQAGAWVPFPAVPHYLDGLLVSPFSDPFVLSGGAPTVLSDGRVWVAGGGRFDRNMAPSAYTSFVLDGPR